MFMSMFMLDCTPPRLLPFFSLVAGHMSIFIALTPLIIIISNPPAFFLPSSRLLAPSISSSSCFIKLFLSIERLSSPHPRPPRFWLLNSSRRRQIFGTYGRYGI